METTQCEKLIIDFNPWVRGSATPRQCKRRATIGEKHCQGLALTLGLTLGVILVLVTGGVTC